MLAARVTESNASMQLFLPQQRHRQTAGHRARLHALAGPGEYVVDLKAQPAPGATQTEHAEARREGVERPGGGTYSRECGTRGGRAAAVGPPLRCFVLPCCIYCSCLPSLAPTEPDCLQ